jgi:hypothetical protein
MLDAELRMLNESQKQNLVLTVWISKKKAACLGRPWRVFSLYIYYLKSEGEKLTFWGNWICRGMSGEEGFPKAEGVDRNFRIERLLTTESQRHRENRK